MAQTTVTPQISYRNVALEEQMHTLPFVKTSDLLGGTGEYFYSKQLAALLGYYTHFDNNTLSFESFKPEANPITIVYDLKNNIGYAYNQGEKVEGVPVSSLPSYKKLTYMPIKVQGYYFVYLKEFCEALGLETSFILSLEKGAYEEIKNPSLVIMTPKEDETIKEQIKKLMNNELLECRCTQAGLTTHIADIKHLETGEGMNSLACYLITEKYGATKQLPKVKNTTGEYKGKGANRLIIHIKENKDVSGTILKLQTEDGKLKTNILKYALDVDRSLDRAVRFSSDHQMGTLSENFSIDTIIEDYNRLVDLYNKVYSKSDIKLSKIID